MTKICGWGICSAIALWLSAGTVATAWAAEQADFDESVQFDIPAHTPLGEALIDWSTRTGLVVMTATNSITSQLTVRDLKGTLPARAALVTLLTDSGLDYSTSGNTVTIAPASDLRRTAQSESADTSPSFFAPPTSESTTDSAVEPSHTGSQTDSVIQLQEIVITGSKLSLPISSVGGLANVYTTESIDKSGQTSIAQFLNTLPEVSVANSGSTGENNVGLGGSTTVQLHGLPVGTTLVLVNGRRMNESAAQATRNYFDLNTIPLLAVDRIEIVPAGASAIYGSDAIAGVVNVILKKSFSTIEVDLKGSRAANTKERLFGISAGHQWDELSASITLSYQDQAELLGSNRAITASSDYSRFGGSDLSSLACLPGNVFSVDGITPLPGLGTATFAAVPRGTYVSPPLSAYAATAGTLNKCGSYQYLDLLPRTRRTGAIAQFEYNFTAHTQLFGEFWYTHLDVDAFAANAAGFGALSQFGGPGFSAYTVSADNPHNPFGTTVAIQAGLNGAPAHQRFADNFYRPLLGVRGSLSAAWSWEVAASLTRDTSHFTQPNYFGDSAAIQAALNSNNAASALNPFSTSAAIPSALLSSLFPSMPGDTYKSTTSSADAVLRGTVIDLPAGALSLATGVEVSRYVLNFNDPIDGYPDFEVSRRTYSGSVEVRAPLFATPAVAPTKARELLALNFASRYDHYSDVGGKETNQFSLDSQPLDHLSIRAAYSQSFKAPSLGQLNLPAFSGAIPVLDPVSDTTYLTAISQGGNPNLRPTTGDSRTFGITYVASDSRSSGLATAITHWNIREKNSVQLLDPGVLVANETLFPQNVIRSNGSSGSITRVLDNYVNYGSIDVTGISYDIRYTWRTGRGVLTPSVNFAQTYRYRAQFLPGSPAQERVGVASDDNNWSPRWKGAAALDWDENYLAATVSGRYVSRYRDYDPLIDGTYRINGDFWLFDASVRIKPPEKVGSTSRVLRGLHLEIGGINLFNRAPQFSNYGFGFSGGYDPTQYDIRGRVLYARLGSSF